MPEPLASYGLLGDTRTAALVSKRGSIDWFCVPRFDGEPVFGSLIDPEHGGRWSLAPSEMHAVERGYNEHATSIRTRWEGPSGSCIVTEGMLGDASTSLMPRTTIVRSVRCISGTARVTVSFEPRLGLPGRRPQRIRTQPRALACDWGSVALGLTSDRDAALSCDEPFSFDLNAGEQVTLVLSLADREPLVYVPPGNGMDLLDADDRWWRSWIRCFDYEGPHAPNIARSLITLRLLTYAPSGAPVAAPTTSLPAPPGSDRTWDYRFSWPRDASIGLGAFLAFGSHEEPRAFLEWLVNASRVTRPRLDVVYNLDGRPLGEERTVAGVAGFDGGAPVRVGNAAGAQHQLDVYGWVLDGAWKMHQAGEPMSRSHWHAVRAFASYVAEHWAEPDNGVWEERGAPQQFVHSKLMAWTALDRAIKLAEAYPARDVAGWRAARDELAAVIHSRGYSARLRSYRRVFDRDELDASLLVLPSIGFEDGGARIDDTIDAIRRELGAGGALLYRTSPGGERREGAFLPCSFWLVQALAETGRLDEAEEAFDELCELSTPLGLYAEQIDPKTKEPMGNFPQAFSHATFLLAAAALSEARGTSRGPSRTVRVPGSRRQASARRS